MGRVKTAFFIRDNDLYSGGFADVFKFVEPIGVAPKKGILTKRQREILKLLEKESLSGIQIVAKLKNSLW
jgi:hypothetical protein